MPKFRAAIALAFRAAEEAAAVSRRQVKAVPVPAVFRCPVAAGVAFYALPATGTDVGDPRAGGGTTEGLRGGLRGLVERWGRAKMRVAGRSGSDHLTGCGAWRTTRGGHARSSSGIE